MISKVNNIGKNIGSKVLLTKITWHPDPTNFKMIRILQMEQQLTITMNNSKMGNLMEFVSTFIDLRFMVAFLTTQKPCTLNLVHYTKMEKFKK